MTHSLKGGMPWLYTALFLLFLATIYLTFHKAEPRTMTATLTLDEEVEPDRVTVFLYGEVNGSTPGRALSSLLRKVKNLPVNASTNNINVFPVYEYPSCFGQEGCNEKPVLKGYKAVWRGTFSTEVKEVEKGLLSLEGEEWVRVDRISFSLSQKKKDEVERGLLKEGLEKLKEKGRTLGFPNVKSIEYSITFSNNRYWPVPYLKAESGEGSISSSIKAVLHIRAVLEG